MVLYVKTTKNSIMASAMISILSFNFLVVADEEVSVGSPMTKGPYWGLTRHSQVCAEGDALDCVGSSPLR